MRSAAFSVLIFALAGCAQAAEQNQPGPASGSSASTENTDTIPGFVSLEEVPAFYREAVEEFPQPLPAGAAWPQSLPATSTDAEGHYETEGLGESMASSYWQCAWTEEFLEAFENNEQSRQTEALAMLEKRVTDPFFTAIYSDPQQGWKRDVLDPAKRGDVSEMKAQHGSCRPIL